MAHEPVTTDSDRAGEWRLTREELGSLRSTRRLFLCGLASVAGLSVGAVAFTAWVADRRSGDPFTLKLVASLVAFLALAAAAVWCARRAWIIGDDIRNGRADMRCGRVTRVWRHLRVAEVEGCLFPLQVAPVPPLRTGERVWLRFAPRSRITLDVRTPRQVVAAERVAGRPPCPAAPAQLGEESCVRERHTASQRETPGNC